jgi:hypothetical protein
LWLSHAEDDDADSTENCQCGYGDQHGDLPDRPLRALVLNHFTTPSTNLQSLVGKADLAQVVNNL